jgi:hypothetical protein
MTGKFSLKVGNVEIGWEGEAAFLQSDLPELISVLLEAIAANSSETSNGEISNAASIGPSEPKMGKTFTTGSIAAKYQPKSASDLFKIALYKLHDSDGLETATRSQIHDEMKQAPKFYKRSMLNNLSNTIDTLLAQGEINEPSSGYYALSHDTHEVIEARV